jgi:hypothetical protein
MMVGGGGDAGFLGWGTGCGCGCGGGGGGGDEGDVGDETLMCAEAVRL